eukprot:TRINITY_DN850_c0_g1_i4.p1 TRINITY_DN850_c0_g1~~TRINITY_DN850_c0_g1_i4.p1  ORF type:complete len:124 (+),score=15.76 TRINITY_DN850_c0_g1_i4:346-717(+)
MIRDSVPSLFDDVRLQATKRAKTHENAPATPAKLKPSARVETPTKPDLYLEKLQKGAEKLKAVGNKFLEDQKNIDRIQVKQHRTRQGVEPGARVIPNLGAAPQTPKPPGSTSSHRSRLASLLK